MSIKLIDKELRKLLTDDVSESIKNSKRHAVIAGGFLRDMLAGDAPRDVDIFTFDLKLLHTLQQGLEKSNVLFDVIDMTEYGVSDENYINNVQIILVDDINYAINRFNYACNMISYDFNTLKTHHELTLNDIMTKRLTDNYRENVREEKELSLIYRGWRRS